MLLQQPRTIISNMCSPSQHPRTASQGSSLLKSCPPLMQGAFNCSPGQLGNPGHLKGPRQSPGLLVPPPPARRSRGKPPPEVRGWSPRASSFWIRPTHASVLPWLCPQQAEAADPSFWQGTEPPQRPEIFLRTCPLGEVRGIEQSQLEKLQLLRWSRGRKTQHELRDRLGTALPESGPRIWGLWGPGAGRWAGEDVQGQAITSAATLSARSVFQGFTARYLLLLKHLAEVCDPWSPQNLISLNPAQPHTRWGVLSCAGMPGAVPRPGCSQADLFCGLIHCCNLACDSLGGGLGGWEQRPVPEEHPRCFVQEGSGGSRQHPAQLVPTNSFAVTAQLSRRKCLP